VLAGLQESRVGEKASSVCSHRRLIGYGEGVRVNVDGEGLLELGVGRQVTRNGRNSGT